MANQLSAFLESRFSNSLCGFRKGYNTQHYILNLLRTWQNCISKSGRVGAILTDLSKAFDCLPHDLLLAKLEAYGFGKNTLRIFLSYLSNRKHRVRIGSFHSSWLEVLLGVPQGSVLGPILFNLFINDLLFMISNISNFADDNTLFACDTDLSNVIKSLESNLKLAVHWFNCNALVANPSKFQLIFPGTDNPNITITFGNYILESVDIVTLLGIKIDNKLSFVPHVSELCKRSNQKTRALMRIRKYMSEQKASLLINAYIFSSFAYCPLVWMFCGKTGNKLIKQSHKKALRVLRNDFEKSYEELLLDTKNVTVHTQNLRHMLVEVYKSLNSISPVIMQNFFTIRNCRSTLRSGNNLVIPPCTSSFYSNTFEFRAAMGWNQLPGAIKALPNLDSFKKRLGGISIFCSCKICQ